MSDALVIESLYMVLAVVATYIAAHCTYKFWRNH